MSLDDPAPDWVCACGGSYGGSKKRCDNCGWTYETLEQYKKAADIENANVGITDDEKLIADSERLLAICSELNEQFKSKLKDTNIKLEKILSFRKTDNNNIFHELIEIRETLKYNTEEINSQTAEQEFNETKRLIYFASKYLLI